MNTKDIQSRRSRILAVEQWKTTWPAKYHAPGEPYADQLPFFEQALAAYRDHFFGKQKGQKDVPLVVMLEGATGGGKTHLAAVLTLFAAMKTGDLVQYLSCETMASRLSTRRDADEHRLEPGDIMEQVDRADIVVLDDLGTQAGLAKSILPGIIEACQADMKFLIGTTNQNEDALIESVGERGLSRLKAGVWIRIPLSVPDFRTNRRPGG